MRLGALFPAAAEAIAALEVARINLLIALLIWGMIYPRMLAVDFSSIAGMILLGVSRLLVHAPSPWGIATADLQLQASDATDGPMRSPAPAPRLLHSPLRKLYCCLRNRENLSRVNFDEWLGAMVSHSTHNTLGFRPCWLSALPTTSPLA